MDLMDLVAGRAKMISEGTWREKRVVVALREEFAPHVTEEMRDFATSRFLERQAKNPKLFDGDARHLSLRHSRINKDLLWLAVGSMKYSVYDACRMEFVERFGWDVEDLPTGIGSCAVVVTSDSKIVMHRRSEHVDLSAQVALIGGIYDGGTPFEHIRKEFWEELLVAEEDIASLLLLGISNRLEERINHEFNFFARLLCSAEQLLRWQENVADKEGIVFFVDCDPAAAYCYIEENYEKMTAGNITALILAGRHLWGKEWSQAVRS